MKCKLIIITMFVLFVLGMASAITVSGESVATRASNIVDVSLLKYEPIPARPGNYIDVYLKFDTLLGSVAQNAAVKFDDQFPFSIVDKSKSVQDIGFYSGTNDAVVKYRLYIDPVAPPGTNRIEFSFTSDKTDSTIWQKAVFDIDIQLSDVVLSIDQVKTII